MRFCGQCGAALAVQCGACASEIAPGDRFCGACGTPVGQKPPGLTPDTSPLTAGVSERRLVTVLFADLVGFTSLSEHRDPDAVRELMGRYYDRCRFLIERYGGTVAKFIGDAVMAVWGTPVAREDDAERAVRAALTLTGAVTALGEEVGMPQLRVRAGVLTGNAAVDLGAEREGMVLGDTVNTASRLQSIAAPGTVLVDDVTRRASEAAIAYEQAGEHQVKGREQPVRAWTALRVVAGAGGARRSAGLEAPFVGRQRELEAVIEAGEESARLGRAGLVTVVGEAGAGKSRVLWEFFKYLDGIEEVRWWHQGRCLSYGEGVAYWALAEMVRARAGITEEEPPEMAREKLRATVQAQVADERERRLVEPRLAHLLRLEERPEADRADLFSGWRLFFERMAQTSPVILAFEDLQWADSGLLDFIDYLLEWSAEFPIFVIALGRTELRERRPGWEPLMLSPLEPRVVAEILDGWVPGLPGDLVAEVSRRAEGIPLYAVETIRMLQDRGLLVQEGPRYVVSGDVSNLDVPETLHALVASRLDGLSSEERHLLQDAAVLGQSFAAAAVAALRGRREVDVIPLLERLVAKQVLLRDDDPRSPERGQYAFLQGLVRTVAYGTLAGRTRKAKHLAAAAYLRESWPGETADIAEVLASHYLEAIRADPGAEDVGELRASARETLTAAGHAASSLALGPEADRYFGQAAELAADDLERAELFELAGSALWRSGDAVAAERRLREAVDLRRARGNSTGGSAAVTLASLLSWSGRLEEAGSLLEPFRAAQNPQVEVTVRAEALVGLATNLMFAGAMAEAAPLFEEALTTLEQQQAWPELADGLVSRAVYLISRHRPQEAMGILNRALVLADEQDLPSTALRARYNLSAISVESHQFEATLSEVGEGLALARERGDRSWEDMLRLQAIAPMAILGRWDEAIAAAGPFLAADDYKAMITTAFAAGMATARGDGELLQRCSTLAELHRDDADVDMCAAAAVTLARAALERDDPAGALGLGRPVLSTDGVTAEVLAVAYWLCVEAALVLADEQEIEALAGWVDGLPPARAAPLLRAARARLRAEQAHRRGEPEAAQRLEQHAIDLIESVGARPMLAQALLDRARRRDDPAALSVVRKIYAELGASRWLAVVADGDHVAA
jgi:class 3 adenylate cyclase/predicted ATPase